MINVRSLRFRLALWYFCTVAAICALAAGAYWLAIASALNNALDQGLRYRLIGLHQYLEEVESRDPHELVSRLREISRIGELYQVFDEHGGLVAESFGLARHRVPRRPPADLGSEIRYEWGGSDDFPLRIAWQKAQIGEHTLIVAAADPQRKFQGVLTAFRSVMLLSMLVTLGVATICGMWLGRRALAPVARITDDARAITERNLSVRLAVPDSRDEIQQLSETLNDMLERIEQSFARVTRFTADASHELRAPVTLMHTAAEYSLRRERSREDLVESMEKILRESRRTTALIDDLLLLARGDANKETDEQRIIDALPLLRDVAEQANQMAVGKQLYVSVRLEAETLPVLANEARLRRLLLILVDNAVKYTPFGGSVMLDGRSDATSAFLSVADTGPGIAPEELPHIFERFWRADKVRSRESAGTGLGLPIAKQIAEQHGATIEVQSEAGRGSIFTLRVPLQPDFRST
jgi:heavy metal sensor kinase